MATLALYAISAYADPLGDRFHLSAAEVGVLSSSLAASYALMQVPAGLVAGRVGLRRGLAAALVLVGGGFVGSACATGFGMLVAFRVLTGAGAGMLIPLGSSLARSVFPDQNMRAQGTLGTGWGLGYVLSLLVLPSVFPSWRAAFVGLGAIALALAGLVLALVPGRRPPRADASLRAAAAGLRAPELWLLGTCLFGLSVGIVGIGTWVKVFGEDQRHLSSGATSALAALIGIGLLPASVAGGIIGRRAGALRVVVASSLGLVAGTLLVAIPAGPALLGLGLLAVGWFSALPFGVILASAGRIARRPDDVSQGVLVGAVNGLAFLGGVVAPPVVGAIRDATGSFGPGFLVLLLGPAIALLALRPLHRSPRGRSIGF
jgi:predicted MFS family arabinose efflux permease